jgi:serine/threonine protein kinase
LKDGNKLDITPLQEQELVSLFKVTHNDIHEGNIIRKCDGNYILIDFGLAAFGHEGARSSISRQGAREYWAPERFDGIFSEQTDIYSFGILAYQMLTNKLPYVYREEDKANSYEGEESQLHRKHADLNIPIPAIEPLRKSACEAIGEKWTGKDYPEWLEKVIMKCLEKKPEKRYANGKELYEDVKSHVKEVVKSPSDNNEEIDDLKKQNKESIDKINKLTDDNQQLSDNLEKLKESKVKVVEKEVIVEKPVEKIVEKRVIKKITNPFWVVTAVVFIIAVGVGYAWIDALNAVDKTHNMVSDLQRQITQLNADKTSLQNQLATAKNNSGGNITSLQNQINSLNGKVSSLEQQVKRKNASINAKDNEIRALEKALAAALK